MDKRLMGLLMFVGLALAAVSLAALQFLNVTNWQVNATLPPAMKYSGSDASTLSNYISVSYQYSNGYNITKISIIGFTGDVTNYTDALHICNYYYNGPLNVEIKYVGPVGGSSNYVDQFVVYNSGNPSQWVGFNNQGTSVTQANLGSIPQGQCIKLGVSVLVDPSAYTAGLANGQTPLATYEVDIIFST